MGLFPTKKGCLAVVCESQKQTKHITIATHFVLHHLATLGGLS